MSGNESHAILSSELDTSREDSGRLDISSIYDISPEENSETKRIKYEDVEDLNELTDEYSYYIMNNHGNYIKDQESLKDGKDIVIESTISPSMAKEIEGDTLTRSIEEYAEENQLAYEVYEDNATEIRIDQDLVKGSMLNDKWRIKTVNNEPYTDSESWIRIEEKNSTAEAARNNNLILSTEVKEHLDGDWLHIYVHDFRNDGNGLLGLEIDLSWNEDGMSLDESRYLKDKIFNKTELPLFANIGEISTTGETTNIRGLSAASLPVAMQGKTLGIEGDGGTTLFAKIPIKDSGKSNQRGLNLDIIKYPAIGGNRPKDEQITIIDDSVPKLLFLKVDAKQVNVGSNIIELVEDTNEAEQSLIIKVININDSPRLVSKEDILIEGKEKEEVTIEAHKYFMDEDGDKLKFEIHPSNEWLQIDENTGLIKGIPNNENVGTHKISVRALDPEGKYADREITVRIENVNDRPYVKKQIPNMNTSQDIHLSLSVKDNYFSDIDKRNDPTETLSFDLETEGNASDWLKIDSLTGILSGTPKNLDVGEYYYKVKAIDKKGESVEQSFFLEVKNINDSPTATSILNNFINIQLKSDDELNEEDQEYSYYTGEHKVIDYSEWFEDIDVKVDKNEKLKIDIFYNDNNGEQRKVTSDNSLEAQWVEVDQPSKTLKIKPTVEDIGSKFLLINVEDQSEASITKIIPIQIRHKNRSPFIELPEIEEWKLGDSGVKNVRYEGMDIHIELMQDKEVNINVPKSIFADNDIGIIKMKH